MKLALLTTAGCHLCEDAEALIELCGLPESIQLIKVDIAEDDELIMRYGEKIPVLQCGQQEVCWPFSLLDLRAFLEKSLANAQPANVEKG